MGEGTGVWGPISLGFSQHQILVPSSIVFSFWWEQYLVTFIDKLIGQSINRFIFCWIYSFKRIYSVRPSHDSSFTILLNNLPFPNVPSIHPFIHSFIPFFKTPISPSFYYIMPIYLSFILLILSPIVSLASWDLSEGECGGISHEKVSFSLCKLQIYFSLKRGTLICGLCGHRIHRQLTIYLV
jgi:hypothetical protein